MIDIKLLRANPELVKENIRKKFQDEKLALVDLPGDAAIWQQEVLDALAQLARQSRQQRIEELTALGGLDEAQKDELRELLRARID